MNHSINLKRFSQLININKFNKLSHNSASDLMLNLCCFLARASLTSVNFAVNTKALHIHGDFARAQHIVVHMYTAYTYVHVY